MHLIQQFSLRYTFCTHTYTHVELKTWSSTLYLKTWSFLLAFLYFLMYVWCMMTVCHVLGVTCVPWYMYYMLYLLGTYDVCMYVCMYVCNVLHNVLLFLKKAYFNKVVAGYCLDLVELHTMYELFDTADSCSDLAFLNPR